MTSGDVSHGSARAALLRRGISLEALTVSYNTVEGVIAIVAGLAAGSVALTGFGVDSVIEVTSGVLLWWRLRAELGSAPLGPAVEARAARWAGILLLGLAVYLVVESGRRLLSRDRPEESDVGIVLMAMKPHLH
jgi:divalent metal cation (Fe/Co/Zn/Cd) transporter